MRAAISVIIPTLNVADTLPACLMSLMEGVQEGLIRDLIISDGGSTDDTPQIAHEAGATWITGPASRGGQLRRGAALVKGDWLLVLHADSRLAPGWGDTVETFLACTDAGYFRLRFDTGGMAARLVAGWANGRARWLGLPYGDQGLLIPRTLYERVGGYEDIPLMEDVALARRLRGHLRPIPTQITTSAARYRAEGWIRRGRRNMWLLLRYLMGASPEALAQSYESASEKSGK